MGPAMERHNRAMAIRRLYVLKDHFGVPQLVVSTAATFVHRFYMQHSFSSAPWNIISSIAFFLSSKVEEQQRPLKYIVTVTLSLNDGRTPIENPPNSHRYQYDETDPNFVDLRKRMLFWEEVMLRTLCFDLTVKQPNHVVLGAVDLCWRGERRSDGEELKRVAWNFLGDSLYTTLSLLHRPNVIAAAAIVCASIQLKLDLPTSPPPPLDNDTDPAARELGEEIEIEPYWLEVLDVAKEEVEDAVRVMIVAYDDASDGFVKAESALAREPAIELAAQLQPPRLPTPPPPPAPEKLAPETENSVEPASQGEVAPAPNAGPISEPSVVPQKRGLEEVAGQEASTEGEPLAVKPKLEEGKVSDQ